MALVDVEGVPVHLGELKLENLMASWKSIQQILASHYTRQLLHELYKVKWILLSGYSLTKLYLLFNFGYRLLFLSSVYL